MNKKQFTKWIKNITDISEAISVENEIEKYPYCMLFHLIQSMKIDSMENNSTLAVLHPNRKILSALLLKKGGNIYFDNDCNTEEPVLKKKTEEKENIVKEVAAKFRDKEDLLDILQKRLAELNNDPNTTKQQDQAEDPLYEPQPRVSLDELVEKFNQFPPKISVDNMVSDEEAMYKDLGKNSVTDKLNIVSETLAKLYYSQGVYDKALKIYEALKQKYPEKSDTFAKIIEDINSKNNNRK
jgi:tetratricopeptide (TPR) repeat protein